MLLLGLETLAMRMDIHSENATKVAEFLEQHPKVSKVYYPGLASSPFGDIVQRQMDGKASSLLSFDIKGGKQAGARFINSLKLISHVANLGDSKTLAIHPASTTHKQLSKNAKKKAHISDSLVRVSVGLEDADDIIFDI